MSQKAGFSSVSSSTLANISIILLVGVLAIVHLKAVIQPLVVATLIFFLIRPPAQWLEERIGGHPLVAYGVLVSMVMGFLFFASNSMYENMQNFTNEAPELEQSLQLKIAWLEDLSIFGYHMDTSALTGLITIETVNSYAADFVGTLAGFTTSFVTVLIFLLFIILEAETLPKRIKAAYPDDVDRIMTVAAGSGEGINTYVVTRATVAFGQAIVAAIVLSAMDIPFVFLWASITFLMDFIPYVGALLSIIPPILLGLIVLPSTTSLLLIALLVANQQVWGGVIEPQLAGQRLDMSPIVLLLLVAFWGWAWGIMGMVLGVPLAVIMKIGLESDDRTRPIAMMLSRDPSLD
jgi:predicted PurR-regulated permease PerM